MAAKKKWCFLSLPFIWKSNPSLLPRYKTTLEVHGGWHHLVFWKTFRIQKKETDPCLIPGRKKAPNHPVFNNCFNDTLSGQTSSGKKYQELHWSWTTGWLPMNCQKCLEKTYPFVAWFYYLNLTPYNLKSIAPQQQIQMQTILTPNMFEVNTINTTIPLL